MWVRVIRYSDIAVLRRVLAPVLAPVLVLAACSSPDRAPGASPAAVPTESPVDAPSASNVPSASTSVTIIRVHYPAGGRAIVLRGSLAPYQWDRGTNMEPGPDDTWTLRTTGVTAPLEVKPLLDDAVWARGPNYRVTPGATVDLYPHFTRAQGAYARAYAFTSQALGNTRGVWIYQPPSYLENTRARMPVVYMHDGQNLFDPGTAAFGNEWKVDETLDAAAEDGTIAEALVIGIENTPDRMSEYTPVADPQLGGGNGAAYLRMIVDELKPRVDAELRTLGDREHTVMVGSSLGGLLTSYAGVERADVFALVGVMSPSTWWDERWLLGEVATTRPAPRPLAVHDVHHPPGRQRAQRRRRRQINRRTKTHVV